MMKQEMIFVLDDGPELNEFTSSKLQIGLDGSPVSAGHKKMNTNGTVLRSEGFANGPGLEEKSNIEDTLLGSQKARPNSLAVVPWSGENAKDFFSFREGLVQSAVQECIKDIITSEDGNILGSWLLTEISFWDHEKERLVLLTTKCLCTIKYDFIALRLLTYRKIPLDLIDTVIMGELSYPTSSIIPSRKTSGVRAMWNSGEPLPFIKKWNPFEKDIPFTTFASHPLLWHKEGSESDSMYNVDDLIVHLTESLEWKQQNLSCTFLHKPILLENYIGLSSLIHNKNSLGFFKVRGKFSF